MKPKCTFKDLCTKTGSHAPAFMTNSFGSGKLIRIRNTDMNYRCYSYVHFVYTVQKSS